MFILEVGILWSNVSKAGVGVGVGCTAAAVLV